MNKKKFRISGGLIFNLIVFAMSIYLILYFFMSEDGLIDLISQPNSFNVLWIIVAFLVYLMNTFVDSLVTMLFIRTKYKHFSFFESMKVAFVGVFFSAITPSSTGGQPMQLFLMAKKNIAVGFGSACMTQKFIVYQIVTALFSVFAVIYKFDYFKSAFSSFWSTLLIICGFCMQMIVTGFFLLVSFSPKITLKLISLISKIMHKLSFIKNPEAKIERLKKEVNMFHNGNKELYKHKKLLAVTYFLVLIQVVLILSAPYFIYLSFDMPNIAAQNSAPVGTFIDFICIQSFVLFTSNLVPLPGASGGAELAFTLYFRQFFVVGAVNKIKPAILLWRLVTYYGSIVVSAPFSCYTKDRRKVNELKEDFGK